MPYRPLAPDVILFNATVHTMNAHDLTSTAVAIKDARIVGVGSDDEMKELAGFGTSVEDMNGATILPGLVDAHNHLLLTGKALGQIQLFDCRSIGEILVRVSERMRSTPAGTWIQGRGWDESLLAEQRYPTRHELDQVSPHHPVVLHRVWNKLVANSAALREAGIDRTTPDPTADVPYAGSFDRDEHGEPTGLFRDRAKELVTDRIPAPSEDELISAIERACAAYNRAGITAVCEPGLYPPEIRAFHRARRRGCISVRTDMLMAGWGFGSAAEEKLLADRFENIGLEGGLGDDLLRLEGIKFMADGGVGDRTARIFDPYLDEPDNHGVWIVEPERLTSLIRWVHDLGYSIDSHTCGDEAQEVVVQAYAHAQSENPQPHLRHRVHHAYLPTPAALNLMATHHFPAVVSNPFTLSLGESFVTSLGEARAAKMMPMRTYIDVGVPLAGSSDSPVSNFNPWAGIYSAVTRKTVTGRVLGEVQRISVREAIRSYTIGGAYVSGRERTIGSIEPGKLADLIVLEHDPFEMPADELIHIKPAATMLGGRWVYSG